ncbi:DegV family protein [Paenibacillus kobensis]|uniref:DegV family protein n=1 Tax=Paenibacillus kobensis TaxID=59841 RepID=UPI000FDC46B5|nr:DegV family protein [Paenibacillus kobensis]
MSTIRIVTDSTADLPAELRKSLGVEMVPLEVLFGEESFLDSVTIGPDEFYSKLAVSHQLPKTSQPSTLSFKEMYERILAETPGATIISIHLSASLSGTYQSAVIGSTMVETADGSEPDITVIDSKSASIGIGVLVRRAAEMVQRGCSKEEILQEVERLRAETKIYFLVDTLEFLQKGGRIGRASAVLGSLLNIKPILAIDDDGFVTSVDKVRGQKKAMARIIELIGQSFTEQEPLVMTIAYAQRREMADELAVMMKERYNIALEYLFELGPVIGTHAGPGTVGLFMHRV